MSQLLETLRRRASALEATIALPEAEDPRVLTAAVEAASSGLCRPLLVGSRSAILDAAETHGLTVEEPWILDPETDPGRPALIADFSRHLAARGSKSDPEALARNPLVYANLLVRTGRAEGAVMGAVATTADTLRAALRTVGVDPRFEVVTSFFLMILSDGRPLVYSDCGVLPAPTPSQLADIAIQAAESYRVLVEEPPRVALLSFSTLGSASHPAADSVRQAVRILKERDHQTPLGFDFEGELQADAALVPEIAGRKAPGSAVAGRANVLVFPDLNSGNIAYKLTERLAGARAIGPLLQGLAGPVHDLSRGCSADDILDTMAISALDAARSRERRKA